VQDELVALRELQQLDLEHLELRQQLTIIPEELDSLRGDVARVSDLLERERQRLAEAEKWRLDREREVQLKNELMQKSKAKLQGARNEKESKAAQREIDAIRKAIQDCEQEAIEVMEVVEQYRKAIGEHTAEFGELEQHLADREAEAREQLVGIQDRLKLWEEKRTAIATRIPAPILRQYERIQKRLGLAVAEVQGGYCKGCNMEMLPQAYIELQRGGRLIQCANCNRILYLAEEPPAGA
jgi:hypothetical protein